MAIKEISEIVGVHSSTLYAWKNRYIKDGKEGIKILKRGREKVANFFKHKKIRYAA
ncbi:MAG TPA: helix-turn-helix domain-containing protein [Sulfurimonas autotrophica]|nr:helix-turn-helix domain-containing protein [Sulfurimonas autotrophica]